LAAPLSRRSILAQFRLVFDRTPIDLEHPTHRGRIVANHPVGHQIVPFGFIVRVITVRAECQALLQFDAIPLQVLQSPILGQEHSSGIVSAGVAGLSLKEFDSGLTRLLYLAVEDISAQRWERVNYRVRDLGRGMISFVCDALTQTSPLARRVQ